MMTIYTHTHAYIIEAQVVRQTCKKKQFQCAVDSCYNWNVGTLSGSGIHLHL